MRTIQSITMFFLFLLTTVAFSGSVYYTEPDALHRVFGNHAVIKKQRFFLSKEQFSSINRMAENSVSSRLVTYYTGSINEKIIGHAYIDTHTAKKNQETILVMISPSGTIKDVVFLRSDESSQFHPGKSWFYQFRNRKVSEQFKLYKDIDAISGATYTSFSIAKAIRRIIAIHKTITSNN